MNQKLIKDNKSSTYFKKFEELLKILDEKYDFKKYKNDNKLYISYDYSDLSNKKYFFRYKGNDNIIGLDEMRKKNPNWEDFFRIIKKLQLDPKKYRKQRNMDPNLVEIIYNEKGENAVYDYLEQLEKGRNANKNALPYSMRYDLTSVIKSKELSFANKISIMKMIRKNKYVSSVDFKRTFAKRMAAVLASFGLLISVTPKLNSGNTDVEKDNNINDNLILDTVDNESVSKVDEKNVTEAYSLSSEEKSRILSQTKEFLERHKQNKIESNKEIEFGTVMQLPAGMQFMEGVSGGRQGMIGDEASPSNGVYVIDYSAEVSENGVTSVHSLEGKINNGNPDSDQFVHISIVKGATNIEEAKTIIEQEKENIKNNCADSKKIQPRGWVSKSTVQQLYNMQQKNTHNIDNER